MERKEKVGASERQALAADALTHARVTPMTQSPTHAADRHQKAQNALKDQWRLSLFVNY